MCHVNQPCEKSGSISKAETAISQIEEPHESCLPTRVIVVLLATLGTVCLFACRVCINVAIVSMVKDPNKNETLYEEALNSTSDVQIVELRTNYKSGIFDWSQSLQGVILGSYFYGYASTQLVAGVLTEKVDPVKFSGFGILIAGLLTISIPFTSEIHVSLVILSMALMGVLHGPSLSCFFKIIKYWVPNSEVSTAMSCVTMGFGVGQGVSMLVTAYLCENGFAGGWPSAFFTIGGISCLWCLWWLFYVTSEPIHHKSVSKSELALIQEGKHIEETVGQKKGSLKWGKALTCMGLWASCFVKMCYGFANGLISTKLPSYIESVLKLELHHNGLVNAFLNLCVCGANLFGGFASDFLITRVKMDKTLVRKLFQSASCGIPAVCLLSIPFSSNPALIIALFIAAASGVGLFTGGDQPIVADMAPDFVGVIFGFTNTFAAAQGILAPLIVGLVLDSSSDTIAAWNTAFFGTSAFLVSGLIFFNLFATAKQQPWGVIS